MKNNNNNIYETKDRSIFFRANDGTVIDHKSGYKKNRRNSV